ncbi:hypothetical protein SAMN05421736_101353 [Evansella caseinilytica]|uniref:Uncharacterized protein n=1 Tax=Evansella caseinilytica TaxID=1503961 RepID=A0A1H3H2P2_9BACI|nr:hypothetical protein SAMN05421736_101353 [Evansella caseinilytica]
MVTFRRCSQMQPECASRVNLRRVTADAGREQLLGGIERIEQNHCLFEHPLTVKILLGIVCDINDAPIQGINLI